MGWLESQAKAMDDPTKADFFLQYPNGSIYSEDIVFGRQWFWNHTNEEASDYFVSSLVESLQGSETDCTFTDDTRGLPAEHPAVMARIGMGPAQLSALQRATARSYDKLMAALAAAGKWDWQAFKTTSPFSAKTCASWMDTYCAPERQKEMMIMSSGADNASIAAFLITRPPVGFMGARADAAAWSLQPGEPKGPCRKEAAGRYSREWSNGVARLDCGAFAGELPFPAAAQPAVGR